MKNNNYIILKALAFITLLGVNILEFCDVRYYYNVNNCGLDGATSMYVSNKNMACVTLWLVIILFYAYRDITANEIVKYRDRKVVFLQKIKESIKEIMISNIEFMIISVIIQQLLSSSLINWGAENAVVPFKANIYIGLIISYIYSCILVFIFWEICYFISILTKNKVIALVIMIIYSFTASFFNFFENEIFNVLFVYENPLKWAKTNFNSYVIIISYIVISAFILYKLCIVAIQRLDYLDERIVNI
ncbi:hypothetical protein [Lachnospira multipara]|uniref:Uncharacterized protein n=1 Tax=Lachnospira multipara TaxID=28051 RepID=A0A1H5SYL2_9FIRM|nr:hypothetical protein [Lachnospira multipara]SEF54877.1 hypothetical protein SAMN05216537_103170 [Lachnospira multipara]